MQSNGLKNLSLVTDRATAAAIKLADRFKMWLGEWFLDIRQGVPYIQTVFVKNPDISAVRQLFRQIILTTPPIVTCNDVQLVYNPQQRQLNYNFAAVTDTGAVITGGDGAPFIVVNPGS